MNARVRPVTENDISSIAQLHERLLGKRPDQTSAALKQSLVDVILGNPWRNPGMPSLVYEQEDGSLAGFIGVVPRPMLINGRKITAAISHSFMVDPASRSRLAAISLIKTFLSGPQQLSLAEGNTVTRKIWEGMGSSTSLLYSLGWTRPLQPAQFFLSALGRRGVATRILSPLKYLCRSIDSSGLARRGPFKLVVPRLTSETLTVVNMCSGLPEFCGENELRPDYDPASLAWLLSMLDHKAGGQQIRKVLLRDDKQSVVGWYLYCVTVGGAWKVLQLVAARHAVNDVLDHLFYQARDDGVVAISGYMDPGLFQPLAAKDCLFRHDGATAWMLFHSSEQEIRDAFYQQKAFMSRLDAEWWIGFLLE